jgi:transglutaminase-like putative cysteine protease
MFAVEHCMRYRFDRLVSLTPHLIRLHPASHCRIPIRAYSLQVEPLGHSIDWQRDAFGNHVARLIFERPLAGFTINIALMVELVASGPFDSSIERSSRHYPFEYGTRLRADLAPYLQIEESSPLLNAWLEKMGRQHCSIVDFLAGVNRRVQNDINYRIRMQPGVQSCEQTLQLQSGSCRDSAWLLVQILRHLGLATRFISGYLLQPATDKCSGVGDCIELHAWAEVYIPGPGWIGLDSTSGFFAGAGHIPLACAPGPLAAVPVSGTLGKCEVTLEFDSTVKRIDK